MGVVNLFSLAVTLGTMAPCAAWMGCERRPPTRFSQNTRQSPPGCSSDSLRIDRISLFSRNQHPENDGPDVDLEELWLDDPLDDLVYVEEEEPEAFLSDDDLALLHDIEIPALVSNTPGDEGSSILGGEGGVSKPLSTQDLTGLSSDLSYFYLRDELGLGEDVMWKIMSHSGSLLGMKASNLRNKVELLRKTIKLSDEDLRLLLSDMPGLLRCSANKHLSPIILLLVRQLDLGTKELRTLVLGCPALLAYSIPNLQKKLDFFRNTMGYSVEETRTLLLKEPRLMRCSVKDGLTSRYRFLSKEIAIPRDDVRKIVKTNPRILMMSVNQNLQPKLIFFMIMTLRLSSHDVRKILLKFPNVLNYDLENHILPITRYFLSLDINSSEVSSMLLKFPRLVTNSLSKIKYVVGYLRFELGLDADGVRRILYQAPQVLSLSTNNLESKVEYLFQVVAPGAQRGDEESTKALSRLIVGMPSLLYLSIEKNMKPKVEYLRSRLGSDGLSEALDRLPMLLAYSLDKRIRPRLEMVIDAGVGGGSITVGMPKKEQDFLEWLDARVRKQANRKDPSKEYQKDESLAQGLKNQPMPDRQMQNDRIMHWTRPRRPRR